MKTNKKVLGLILGGLMSISLVGCSKTDKAEELILENVENTILLNLEANQGRYDYLTEDQRLSIDLAKMIDRRKSKVEIEEVGRKYEVILSLYRINDEGEESNEVYVIEMDKDKFDFEKLKKTDLVYDDDLRVVASFVTQDGINKNFICVEDYRGRTDEYVIYDEYTMKDMLLFTLGDVTIDENF